VLKEAPWLSSTGGCAQETQTLSDLWPLLPLKHLHQREERRKGQRKRGTDTEIQRRWGEKSPFRLGAEVWFVWLECERWTVRGVNDKARSQQQQQETSSPNHQENSSLTLLRVCRTLRLVPGSHCNSSLLVMVETLNSLYKRLKSLYKKIFTNNVPSLPYNSWNPEWIHLLPDAQ